MEERTLKIRAAAKEALINGQVNMVIGYEKGDFPNESCPVFITDAKAVDALIWDAYCISNLSKYLLEALETSERVGIFLKGCDSKAFNQMVKDNRIDKDKVLIFGVPCEGMLDPKKGENVLYEKCKMCENPNPLVFTQLIGELVVAKTGKEDRFEAIKAIEAMTSDERYAFWSDQFSKCIRCYACRNVCPACSCVKCIFETPEAGVLGKAKANSEDAFFHITRAYHVAGRCVDCGECNRVCPEGIPLDLLNKKIIKDITALYGDYEAGLFSEGKATLVSFDLEDVDPFEKPRGGQA